MDALHFRYGAARRPTIRVQDPLMQWSSGLQTAQRATYAGWLIETAQSVHLDQAMREAGYKTVEIRHGGGSVVTHWAVQQAPIFVLAEGVQDIREMKTTPERYGIAFAWRQLRDGRPQSVLKLRFFLRSLLDIGYCEPLQLTVKSTLTSDLLTALMRQYDVLDAIDRERAAKGQPPLHAPFYACSIPLGPGAEVARGAIQKKEIVPIVAQIPPLIDRAYLVQHYIRKQWIPLIENLIDATIAWSVATSREIAAGEQAPASEESAPDEDASGDAAEEPLHAMTRVYRSYGRH